MAHNQHPLGTGFTAAATADEVVSGLDLSSKNVIVTAGHTGIGLEVTRALSKAGASVTVATRNTEKAASAVSGIENVQISQLNLVDPLSIDAFAARWLETHRPLHILINCAGVPAPFTREVDARGFEIQFATNHLGHFQLTLALLPALRAAEGARVVNVSSGAQRFGQIHWDDVSLAQGYNQHVAYAQSKLANVLFTVEFDHRFADDKIRSFAAHPGIVVGTSLNSAAGDEALRAMGLIDETGQAIIDPARGKKTPQQGASTIAFAATSPLLDNLGGVYLADNDVSALDDEMKPIDPQNPATEVTSRSIDPKSAQRLWELSEAMLAA